MCLALGMGSWVCTLYVTHLHEGIWQRLRASVGNIYLSIGTCISVRDLADANDTSLSCLLAYLGKLQLALSLPRLGIPPWAIFGRCL